MARDAIELATAAAHWFADAVTQAVDRSGQATVCLAGGSTPQRMYQVLASTFRTTLPWDRVRLFWGDERCVPPDHPDSNFGLVHRALLVALPIPAAHVHRIPAEVLPVEDAAARYEGVLRQSLSEMTQQPSFDLVLLGIGEDGHTASLFPGSEALDETARWVVPVCGPGAVRPRVRITLTLPVLNRARRTAFLVAGGAKRQPLAEILRPTGHGQRYPAARISARESLVWFVDREACPADVPEGISSS